VSKGIAEGGDFFHRHASGGWEEKTAQPSKKKTFERELRYQQPAA